jgi:hypothetical protein
VLDESESFDIAAHGRDFITLRRVDNFPSEGIGRMTRILMPVLGIVGIVSLSGCGTDTSPKSHFVSDADGGGPLTSSPASARQGVIVADTAQNESGRYFIEFRARYALSYGHSYVVFGRANEAGEMVNPEVAGLHPSTYAALPYVIGHVLPVPAETGASDGDLEEEYRSSSWRVMLNEAQYNKVVAYIRKLQKSSPVWNGAVYNCNAFVADIARYMGYKTPPILLRPQLFNTKLREMNTRPGAAGDNS